MPIRFPAVRDLSQLLGVLLAESLPLSVPSGTASAAESCLAQGHAPSQIGPCPMTEGKKGLAILAQPGTDLKGHSNSRSPCGASQVCYWACITAKYLCLFCNKNNATNIFHFQGADSLNTVLIPGRRCKGAYEARSCWCSITFPLFLAEF